MSYYFLAASLPVLSIDAAPPFSTTEFRALCAEHLSRADLGVFDQAMASETDGHTELLIALHGAETALRNALVRTRASQLRLDAQEYLCGDALDAATERAVADAYSRSNPLDRELSLDKFRWGLLDALAGFDPFVLRALVVYGLKLKIVERWADMSVEQGEQRVESIVSGKEDNTTQKADAA